MKPKVLIYEGMDGHGECLPSYYYYFKELGYDVEFALKIRVAKEKPLWMIDHPKVYISEKSAVKPEHLTELQRKIPNIFGYDLYFIATLNKASYAFVKMLYANGVRNNRILYQCHLNYDYYLKQSHNDLYLAKNGFVLGIDDQKTLPQLSPIRSIPNCEHARLTQDFDKKLNIFIGGLSHIHFKNFEKLVKDTESLNKEGYNIKLNVTGIRELGNYVLPNSSCVNYLGRIDFKDMADHYIKNDYLLVLFDEKPFMCLEDHMSFLHGRVSGSKNMSLIYKIPLVVQKAFQTSWKMDDTNSISFEGHDYRQVLLQLFDIKAEQYNSIIDGLRIQEHIEAKLSLNNLKEKIALIQGHRSPDLVYIVRQCETNEDLRYSLRSVAKFLPYNRVWIVGHKPSWVTNVNYLPVKQDQGNKWKNSVKNIIEACKCKDISENFVLMNDDFFAIKPIDDLEQSVNLSLGFLKDAIIQQRAKTTTSGWGNAFIHVNDLLKSLNIEEPYYNYESHTPLLINKTKYLEVMSLPQVQDFMQTTKVLHKRTLYKNICKIRPRIITTDVKLSRGKDDTKVRKTVCDWLSVCDNQVGNKNFKDLNTLLTTLFPSACAYEKISGKTNIMEQPVKPLNLVVRPKYYKTNIVKPVVHPTLDPKKMTVKAKHKANLPLVAPKADWNEIIKTQKPNNYIIRPKYKK